MANLTGQKVLVTGGAGFIGSHLADTLVEQNEVIVVDDLSAGKREYVPDEATFRNVDLTNPGVIEDLTATVDIVFHQAAIVSVQRSINQPLETHEINTDATLRLLECAREYGFRVVVASSAAIYGHPDSLPVQETDSKTPTSPYGADKLTIDHYARLYYDLYDVETVALRYFNIFGPRQRAGDYGGVISIFREQALDDSSITVNGDGTQTRDFVHVDDVVDANLRAATTDHVGEAYNIGSGEQTSIQSLAEQVRDITDSDSDIVHTDPRSGEIDASVADIMKAERKLGYKSNISLEEGLRTLV